MDLIHCCKCLDCCSWRFAYLVLLLFPALSILVSPLPTVPTLASKLEIVCPRVSFGFIVVFLLDFHSLALLTFPSCLSLAQNAPALTCQGSCAAQGHHRFSVHAKLGKTHDLPREPLSGDRGCAQRILTGTTKKLHHSSLGPGFRSAQKCPIGPRDSGAQDSSFHGALVSG